MNIFLESISKNSIVSKIDTGCTLPFQALDLIDQLASYGNGTT